MFQNAQCISGETIAATFVSGEGGFVYHGDTVSKLVQCEGTCSARGASTNNEDLFCHAFEARGPWAVSAVTPVRSIKGGHHPVLSHLQRGEPSWRSCVKAVLP